MAEQTTLHEPFHDRARQRDADRLGMLIFLASEIMLFGGIFAAATALRLLHPTSYADAAHDLKLWLGTANTAVLLTSSLFAALAVEAARAGRPGLVRLCLWITVALGIGFLTIKGVEYAGEYRDGLIPFAVDTKFDGPVQHAFMNLYLLATGLHAVHVTIGIVLLCVVALKRRACEDEDALLVGNAALYWHLVDIVWIFLFPTLYLAGVQ